MSVYDLHPGLKEIEKEHGLSLKYVKMIPESYASIVSLLKDENTYYVAKTAVKHYEEITYCRDIYAKEILKDTATIIGTHENTWLMKYSHQGDHIIRPLSPKMIIDLFNQISFSLGYFQNASFPKVQGFIEMMHNESTNENVNKVRQWGRDYLINANNRENIQKTIQHGDLLDKNILMDNQSRLVPLDPLPVEAIWYHDLARYIAWNRNPGSLSAREYIGQVRDIIDLPDEFETYVCAVMAVEFACNFQDSSYGHRMMSRDNLIDLAPEYISKTIRKINKDLFIEGIE